MFSNAIIAATFAALAAAAPAPVERASKYFGISLNINTAPLIDGHPVIEPAPVVINQLTSLSNVSASEISFDPSVHINVDINSVECRAYKDADGVIPGSAPFTNQKPALLSTNLVEVGSVLCYITETNTTESA